MSMIINFVMVQDFLDAVAEYVLLHIYVSGFSVVLT